MLCDVVMPGKTGIELQNYISKEYSDIPVIIITGAGGFNPGKRIIENGAHGFIAKPLNPEELMNHVTGAANTRNRNLKVKCIVACWNSVFGI